ncbi:MAG TPA: Ig-like domain-containing protein [Steroidobacteraceae bacterium]|nr:Ig-like domain-containing protein [Steroidobacteraceae bacterium]
MSLISVLRRGACASLLVLLAGCGGGGGGKPAPSPPPPPAPVAQAISFASAGPIAKTFGDVAFTNAAAGGAGTGTITYSSSSTAIATVDGTGRVTIVAAGSVVITANKAADAGHLAATANYTVNIAPAAQSVSFTTAGALARTYGDAPFTNPVVVIGNAGALSFASANTSVATVNGAGQVTIVGAGSTSISATLAADNNHLAAQASYLLNVAPSAQSVSFTAAGPLARTYGDAPFTNAAVVSGGSSALTFQSGNTSVATVDGAGQVTMVGAGSTVITASKAADANHFAAQASYTLNVARAAQTVSFTAAGPVARTYGDAPFTNAAVVSGGDSALSFDSGDTSVATVNSAGQVTILAAGSTVITASKAADNNHFAAQASYTLNVARAPQALAFAMAGPLARTARDDPFANVASGGAGTGAIEYTSNDTAVAMVEPDGTVGVGAAGTAVITATKAASANHLAAQVSFTLNVAPGVAEAPFTAWLNLTDPSPVTLPPASAGGTFSRTLFGNCPSPRSAPDNCVAVTATAVGAPTLNDATAGLGRSAHYWLQRGSTIGRPTTVTTRRYYDSPMAPLAHDGQLWIVGGNEGKEIWSSTDGRAWIQRSATTPWGSRTHAQLVKFNNSFYLIGGTTPWTSTAFNDVWRSDDLINWTRILDNGPFAARDSHQVVVFNGRMWLIGGYTNSGDQRYNDVWSSTDGISWTLATGNAAFAVRRDHRAVAFKGRLWVMGGATGQYDQTTLDDVWSSADGVTWRAENAAPFGPRRHVTTLVFNNRLYVLGGFNSGWNFSTSYSDVWSTADGSTWTQDLAAAPFGGRSRAYLLPYRGRIWLLGGNDRLRPKNQAWSTTDLVNWTFEHTSAPFSPAHPGRLVSFNGRLWMLGEGMDGRFQAWSSVTGDGWTQSPGAAVVPPRNQFNVAVHNNRLWVQGGFAGNEPFDTMDDVWSTADGELWTRATASAPFAPRYGNELFAMNGKLFVMGGERPGAASHSDVWSSLDGATWQREIEFTACGARYNHQIVVFNGRAWLLGGRQATTGQICSSADGVNWQIEGTHGQAVGRYQHRAVVHANRIWIVGGYTGFYVGMNDTWYSSNGISWTQQTTGFPGMSSRIDHGLASFDGKLWLYGGEGSGGEDDSHSMMWSTEGTDWRYRYHNQIEVP